MYIGIKGKNWVFTKAKIKCFSLYSILYFF